MNKKHVLLLILLLVPVSGLLGVTAAADLPDPALASGTGNIGLPLAAEAAASLESSGEQAVPPTGIPLFFIENKGQTSDDILFEVITGGGVLFYTQEGSSISLIGEGRDFPSPVLEYSFAGTSGGVVVEGFDKLPCMVNFLNSPDPASWVTGAETYKGIQYKDLYPGIDLRIEGAEQGIKSTYHVEPGADPSAIKIRYSGQDSLSLDNNGNLDILTAPGVLEETAPVCYQIYDGRRVEVASSYILENDTISFEIGKYNREKELVIDPTLVYGLYLNRTGFQEANGVALDPARNVYVTGKSFPGNGTAGTFDAVVAKINPDGTLPVWWTFIGGSGSDAGQAIRVDADGYAYITGITNSSDFPLEDPVQPALSGQSDAFVTKLSQDGSDLVYSTYLGGRNQDSGMAIALDSARNAYITGGAGAAFNPAPLIPQNSTFTGLGDAYIAKISSSGSTLVYLEYIGGRVIETGYGIDVDGQGNAFITGETFSWSGFPIVNAYQPTFGGYSDAFVTKVGPYGYPLLYSTYLGGSDLDGGRAIDVDTDGYAHITGLTWSPNLPTTSNAYHPDTLGAINSFYSVLGPGGNTLNYSTFLTGPGVDEGRGIAVTPKGSIYITGITKAPRLATINAVQPNYGGGVSDAFVAKFVKGQPIPEYLTYLGGSDKDEAYAIATDDICGAYPVGLTWSTNFPTVEPYPDAFLPKSRGGFLALIRDCDCIPPVANFTANRTSGRAPLAVQFNDTSLNNPSEWFWQFGDGYTSTVQNPVHTYTQAGKYTVNLTVTNECGNDTLSRPVYITVEPPCIAPIANFTANQTTGVAPLTVQFNSTSTGTPPLTYNWSFGDNTTSILKDPVHTYTTPGNYTVNLTVTNECGNDTLSRPVYITVEPLCIPPVANFTANQTSGVAPLTVQFNSTSTGTPPLTYNWSFGDNSTSTLKDPVHTYTTPGNYTVNLTVTNECGNNTISRPVYITVEPPCIPPVANFTANQTSGVAPLAVQFNSTSTGTPPLTYNWSFGDNSTSTLKDPVHTYTTPGNYTVNLTVTNECGNNTISRPITVKTPCIPPVADFTADKTFGKAPLVVSFTDLSLNDPTSWFWELGDGTTSTMQNPVHTYTWPGYYTVRLTVTNDCGQDCKIRHQYITVQPVCLPPIASFTANVTSGTAPLAVQFSDTTINDPAFWQWEFGDGDYSNVQNPVHTYTQAGTYTVKLTAMNSAGGDSLTKEGYITVYPPVSPTQTIVPPGAHAFYGTLTIDDEPAANGTTVTAIVSGGGGFVVTQEPGIYGQLEGQKLIVQGMVVNGSNISFYEDGHQLQCFPVPDGPWQMTYPFEAGAVTELNLRTGGVIPQPPVANFIANQTAGNAPLTVGFSDTSQNSPTIWSWQFGDGNTSTIQNPVHTYETEGIYAVSLTVTNADGNDTLSRPGYINAGPSLPPLPHEFFGNVSILGIPAPAGTVITGMVAGGGGSIVTDVNGVYGDGPNETNLLIQGHILSGAPISFAVNGTPAQCYDVMVGGPWMTTYPYAEGGLTRLDLNVTEIPAPVANFTVNRTQGNAPMPVSFICTSENSPTSWAWDFGDGGNSTSTNPVHTYSSPGTYTVGLTVGNSGGNDSLSRPALITVLQPEAAYYISATAGIGGTITPSGLIPVAPGASQTFSISPSYGYRVRYLTVDGGDSGPVNLYTFNNIDSNHTITAYFVVISGGSGGGGGGGGGGDTVYLTPTPTPTVNINALAGGGLGEGGDGATPTPTVTTITVTPTITPDEANTTAVPNPTPSIARPFWLSSPLIWVGAVVLAIAALAALAYYFYQREGEDLYEEK